MERSEPAFVPKWYKGSSNRATSSFSLNHHSASSHPEGHKSAVLTRNRFSVNAGECDSLRSSSFTDRTSSFQKSARSNGTMGWAKDVIPSRPYNSLERSHRDRDKDREKDQDLCEKQRSLLLDNELSHCPDLLNFNRPEEDSLRRSQSMVSGRHADSWYKRPGHDSSNGVPSGGISSIGVNKKGSFEKEFPSLGAEEKYFGSDVARVSSPGLSSAIHNLPLNGRTNIGGDGWTSALAEVPPLSGGNGQAVSSALQTIPSPASTASSNSTGLNMAEAVALAPARVHVATQLPSDSQKIEDLHLQQVLKLIPMTPSFPKTSGINLADKSKVKGTRPADSSNSKAGQHVSSQAVNHILPSAVRADAFRTTQSGNFKVLERNGLSPTGKDGQNLPNVSRIPATTSGSPPAVITPVNCLINPKLKVDGRVHFSTQFGEKKPISQAQNRNDFFNSLRKKTSASRQATADQSTSCADLSSNSEHSGVQVGDDSASVEEKPSSISTLKCLAENGNCSTVDCDAPEVPGKIAPDEEEKAFLRSLGWEENAGEEALTHEEIESFLLEYKRRMPASKLKI